MSISFHGVPDSRRCRTLDLNNGLASDILRAIGFKVGESSDGEMPIEAAKVGIQKAKMTLGKDQLPYLGYLEELVTELEVSGAIRLTWG
jgi:hypothetical protein